MADFVGTFLKLAVALGVLLNVVPVMVWVERRAAGLIQDRPGPNRLGPLGLFQALADALKFMFKEDVTPSTVDRPLYLMAPVLGLLPALATFSVVPFGPALDFRGHHYDMVIAPAETGVLLFLALASLGVYSLVVAGYASPNEGARCRRRQQPPPPLHRGPAAPEGTRPAPAPSPASGRGAAARRPGSTRRSPRPARPAPRAARRAWRRRARRW